MKKRNLFFTCCFVLSLFSCKTDKDWGKVSVKQDEKGNWEAFLENEKMKVRYGYGMGQGDAESCIREVILKDHPDVNLAGPFIDASAHRGLLIKAEIISDTPEEKTIYRVILYVYSVS